MNRIQCLAAAFALACGVSPVAGQVVAIEPLRPETLPVIRPTIVERCDNDTGQSWNVMARHGAVYVRPGGGFSAGTDPNLVYRQWHVFPEVVAELRLGNENLGPFRQPLPVTSFVVGMRGRWQWPPPDTSARPPELAPEIVWRWDAPEEWRRSYQWWSQMRGHERYSLMCLLPVVEPIPGAWSYDGPRRAWPRDPQVVCFDAEKGVRWRTDLPVTGYMAALPPPALYPMSIGGERYRSMLAIRADGERAVVGLYPPPDSTLSLLFALNGAGAVTHAWSLADRRIVRPGSTKGEGGIHRVGDNAGFVVAFEHRWEEAWEGFDVTETRRNAHHESYLLDGDGRPVGRFVYENGRPALVSSAGATRVAAWHGEGEGRAVVYIYDLAPLLRKP